MENHEHKQRVRIHIDEKPYESPNPSTGEALHKLGHVLPGFELFREIQGDKEDPVVPDERILSVSLLNSSMPSW